MKKKLLLIGGILLILIIGLIIYLFVPISDDKVKFTVNSGDSASIIINNLKEDKLIKSKLLAKIYLKLNDNIVLKSGEYVLTRDMSISEIFNELNSGITKSDGINVFLEEGKRVKHYASVLSGKLGINEEEFLKLLNDTEYIKTLMNKYTFIKDDVLNDKLYYKLEGYLFPDTYEFKKDSTSKEVIERILDNTSVKINKYLGDYKGDKSIHEILTIASIIENESMFDEDRKDVSQVIYKRLDLNMSLGMDVTTYYSAKKDLSESLTKSDLNKLDDYNTRNTSFIGLPIGPICNPGVKSIEAAINPSNNNYIYFYADIRTGKLYFAENYNDFLKLIEKYR